MSTLLADLVRRQTTTSLLGVFSRTVDKVAEDLAQELLRDPAFRDDLRELIRAAFTQTLRDLREPAPPDPLEARRREIDTAIQEARERAPKPRPPLATNEEPTP
jgi:hypothetical protein